MTDTTQGQDPTNAVEPQQPAVEPQTFDADYVKQLRQEAAAHRVAAQQRQQELEAIKAEQAKREQEEAEKRGEYERLYRETAAQKDQLATELEELRTFRAQVAEREEAERKQLLAQLPADVRDAFETATAEQIRVVMAKLSATGSSPDPTRGKPRTGTTAAETPPALRPGQPGWLAATLNNE